MANPPNPPNFGFGRKLEHPEETYADTERMCKLHTDSDPRPELILGSWRCEAAVLTIVPLRPHVKRSLEICIQILSRAWLCVSFISIEYKSLIENYSPELKRWIYIQ